MRRQKPVLRVVKNVNLALRNHNVVGAERGIIYGKGNVLMNALLGSIVFLKLIFVRCVILDV